LRDALKHRAAIDRKTGLARLFGPRQEIGKGRLLIPGDRREQRLELGWAAVSKGRHDHARGACRAGVLPPDSRVEIGTERRADPVQQQQRRRSQDLGEIDRHAVSIGNRMHQRARQIHQPAAPQNAIGDLEDM
jgi:hypothetical protein